MTDTQKPKCECGKPDGQCVKGDMAICPDIMDEMMGLDDECERCGRKECDCDNG